MKLIGETQGRPQGERVPINIDENVREKLRNLLYEPEMRGVGWSEFIDRAVDLAWEQLEVARDPNYVKTETYIRNAGPDGHERVIVDRFRGTKEARV
jgi:hypothetical protein